MKPWITESNSHNDNISNNLITNNDQKGGNSGRNLLDCSKWFRPFVSERRPDPSNRINLIEINNWLTFVRAFHHYTDSHEVNWVNCT